MKALLLSFFLLTGGVACAQSVVVVDSGTVVTAVGIGGSAQLAYAFGKGDVVNIEAKASKQLASMVVSRHPQPILGRVKLTKQPKLSFTMEEEGIVVFRFISDRDGTTIINYTVTRMPADAELQEYNTKVTWKMGEGKSGQMVPERVK
jgi:hypothetical protein